MSYVSISGNIATGKSTLLDLLMEEGYNVVPEDLGPEFMEHLAAYNEDPSKALDLQNYINDYRFFDAVHATKSPLLYIHERCMADDIVFASVMAARGEIEMEDAEDYIQCAIDRMKDFPPSKIIYLYCDPEVGYERMRKRGRAAETGQNLLRIAELEEAHLRVLPEIADELGIELVEVDWTNYGDVKDIIKEIGGCHA